MINIKLSHDEIKELMNELEEGLFDNEIQIKDNSTLNQTLYKIENAHINKAINDNIFDNKNYYRNAIDKNIKEYSNNIYNQISIATREKLTKNKQSIEGLKQKVENSNAKELVHKMNKAEKSIKSLRYAINILQSNFLILTYMAIIIGLFMGVMLFILLKLF